MKSKRQVLASGICEKKEKRDIIDWNMEFSPIKREKYIMERILNKHLTLLTIVSSSIITLFASDIFLPSLPNIAEYFAVTNSKAQLSISFFLGGQVLTTLFWGFFSDRLGRQKAFQLGMGIFLIGTIICIDSTTITIFLIGRLIQGIGGVAVPVIGWAIIQDLYPKDKSAGIMSWIGSIIALAPMTAPALGGQLDKLWGWKADFYFIFILTTLILICQLIQSKEKSEAKKSTLNFVNTYTPIIKDKIFLSYIAMFALLACGQWCFLTIAPILYKNTLNLSSDKIGYLMSFSALFFIFGTTIANRLIKKTGIDFLLSLGAKLSFAASLVLLFFHVTNLLNALLISVTFGMYLFGAALLWGSSSSRALQCYETNRGSASAIRSLLMIALFTLGSYLGALINNNNLLQIAALMSIFSLLSIKIYHSRALSTHRSQLNLQSNRSRSLIELSKS